MKHLIAVLVAALSLTLTACNDKKDQAPAPELDKAAAPAVEAAPAKTPIGVPEFAVSTTPEDIKKGEALFAAKGCVACHKIGGGKLVGPDLKGVTARRDEKWIKSMILRPDIMVKEDDLAKKLLGEHFVPMPNQNVDPKAELPFLMSYLKSAEK